MRRNRNPEKPTAGWIRSAWDLVEDPKTKSCDHCKGYHTRACPRVKRITFYPPDPDGVMQVKEVEFFPHGEWPHESVIFADSLPIIGDEET